MGLWLLSIAGCTIACAASRLPRASERAGAALSCPARVSSELDGGAQASEPRPAWMLGVKSIPTPKGSSGYVNARDDYPAEARKRGIEGRILMRLVIDEHGLVTAGRVLTPLGDELDMFAMRLAADMEFEPARDLDDVPVPSVILWIVTLTLPK